MATLKLPKKTPVAAHVDAISQRLQASVDNLHEKRTARLAAQKAVDLLEEQEKEIRADVEGMLRELKQDTAKGARAMVYFTHIQVPQLTDEEAFFTWARRKDNRDVMKVGVNNEAWRLRIADGVAVPGTEGFLKTTLQVKGVK